jgi:hypothetical protein
VWSYHSSVLTPEVLLPHANATLTERGRLKLAQCVVDDQWPLRRAAERFQVSVNTAERWADWCTAGSGASGCSRRICSR